MATQYPSAIDNSTSLPLVIDNITEVNAETVNRLRFAVLAIEQALGINPQGAFTSFGVKARLDDVDNRISSLDTSLSTILSSVGSIIDGLDGESILLGTPALGFSVGISTLETTTPITEAINSFNNIILYLAPDQAQSIDGLAIDAVTSLPIFSGKVADVTGHAVGYFKTGLPAGSTYTSITQTQSFVLTTHTTGDSTTGFSDGDKGLIQVLINGVVVSTFNLGIAFDETYRANVAGQGITYDTNTGNASAPLKIVDANIQVYSVGMFNGFPLWQKGVIRITNSSLTSGYNTFVIKHTVNSTLRTSQTFELFYDNGALNPTFPSTPILSIGSSSNSNYLSGIKYLTIGDSLVLQATINNAFVKTYLQTPLAYSFTTAVLPATSSLSDVALVVGPTGTASIPNITDHITISKTFNITEANNQTINQIATINYSNVYGTAFTAQTATQNILINTYDTNISTDSTENFLDEVYRLVPDIDGYDGYDGYVDAYPNDYTIVPPNIPPIEGDNAFWDSTSAIVDGNAQVFNSKLIYPVQNFTTGFLPIQTGDTNYSAFSNSNTHLGQVYYRIMYSATNPRSTGTLTIGGIVLTDLTQITPNVKVEMKLPGITGWLDFSLLFDNGTFSGITGDGCRTGNTGNTFGWSAGIFSTASSGYSYILRITLFNATKEITSLIETFVSSF